MNWPIVVRMTFISFNVGTTTPKEIVEIIMTINKTSSIKPNHLNMYANTMEIIMIKANTVIAIWKWPGVLFSSCSSFALVRGSFLNVLKSISNPLKNMRKIKPKVDKILSMASFSTKLRKECPMIIPMSTSTTTTGMKFKFSLLTSIGVRKAARTTTTRDTNSIVPP